VIGPPPIPLQFFLPSASARSSHHLPLASLPSRVGRRPPKPHHLPTDLQESFVHLPPSEHRPSLEFGEEAPPPPTILTKHHRTPLHSLIWSPPHLPFPRTMLQEPTGAPPLAIIGCTSPPPFEPPHRRQAASMSWRFTRHARQNALPSLMLSPNTSPQLGHYTGAGSCAIANAHGTVTMPRHTASRRPATAAGLL
jgi:hypothetical protein